MENYITLNASVQDIERVKDALNRKYTLSTGEIVKPEETYENRSPSWKQLLELTNTIIEGV